jgi:integrase
MQSSADFEGVRINGTDPEALKAVNKRLETNGGGWVGYLFAKRKDGSLHPSRYLYLQFYVGKEQKRINTKTNNPEQAYKQMLDNRRRTDDGERVLPSEASKIRYEDLIQNLMAYYREHHPASLRTRKTDGGTEETFDGKDNLDEFFGGMPITQITAKKIQDYIKKYTKMGYSGATVRRQLSRLQSAFVRTKDLDQITNNHIPSFRLPKDSKAREGFLDLEDFEKFRKAMPEHLRPVVLYLYFTGSRMGEVEQITWGMVSKDCKEIIIPGRITKTDDGRTVPLVGPLEEIATMLREERKGSPKPHDTVFNLTNFRRVWNRTCHRLGLGVYDESTQNRKYSGLHPHDFRRSAARNLIKAGVPRSTAMLITGHKTEAIFERYNIKDTSDAEAALIKVGNFSKAKVAQFNRSL